MNKIETIKERIQRVIRIEKEITERERDEFQQKKWDEESYYGIGGNYRRFETCQQKREQHLRELEQLERGVGSYRPTEELRLYPFYCPDCQVMTYLNTSSSRQHRDIIDCPLCNRTLYRTAENVVWEVISGSRRAKT